MKKVTKKKLIAPICLAVLAIGLFSFKSSERNFRIAKNLDIFNSVVKELNMFYVDTINPDKTVSIAINSMLASLDPYTNYFPEEEESELKQMLQGSYGGIGSVISYDSKRKLTTIAEPYKGMPAQEIGLKAGDILLEIDGKDLTGKTTRDVSNLLRGQNGTSFKLKIERPGTKEPLTFNVVRKSIQLPTVPYSGVIENGIGYINLNSFSGKPSKEFKKAFLNLKDKGITSLVIDLRSNPGGLLSEAVEIANFFLPKGKVIATTKGRLQELNKTYKTLRNPIDPDIPIAVLVGSSSASAAEILSGSLQDLDRAVIVGTRTFGKGLVQVPRSLPYGGNLKLTTSKYYIPSGRCVQAIDYSHRNKDGSVGRVPDSLTHVFYTEAGREVRDGGGITPDTIIDHKRLPNILYYLVRDNLIFNYATDYCLKHSKISNPSDFVLTDEDYNLFKEKVKKADFKYDQESLKILKNFKKAAEFEGYSSSITKELSSIEKKLEHDLNRDLDYFSKDIQKMISIEIIKRYYYQEGSIIEQLKGDEDLNAAIKILKDKSYHKILAGTK